MKGNGSEELLAASAATAIDLSRLHFLSLRARPHGAVKVRERRIANGKDEEAEIQLFPRSEPGALRYTGSLRSNILLSFFPPFDHETRQLQTGNLIILPLISFNPSSRGLPSGRG